MINRDRLMDLSLAMETVLEETTPKFPLYQVLND
jgi:hypothetical protein